MKEINMTTELLIDAIHNKNKEIRQSLYEIDKLIEKLENANAEEWDWVSVKKAADTIGVCPATLYSTINTGSLDCKYIGSKKLVSMSQVKNINDREVS